MGNDKGHDGLICRFEETNFMFFSSQPLIWWLNPNYQQKQIITLHVIHWLQHMQRDAASGGWH